LVVLVLLALALATAAFLLEAHLDLNLCDEGYLWYGAMAVAKGHVPLRDFGSYDPGRYYWTAAWFWLLGDRGIIPLRIACAAFNFVGLLCGLLVLRRLTRAWYVLVPAGALLTLWMFPTYYFNHAVALVAVYVALLLIERPNLPRHLLAGIFVGLAAFFGRNHGVYGLAAFAALILLIWWKLDPHQLLRRVAVWGGGIVLGYSPMLLMLAFVPGFWAVNFTIMRSMTTEIPAMNIGKPIPWPWQQSTLWEISVGMFFVLAPLCFVMVAGWIAFHGKQACMRRRVLLAATLVGIPYLHYAFFRADIEHLAMSIHPFLIAVIALVFAASGRWRWPAVGLVAGITVASLVAVGAMRPLYRVATARPGDYVPMRLGRWTIEMPKWSAAMIEGALRFQASVLRPGDGFLIVGQVPGLYAILDRDSPVYQTVFVIALPEGWQRRVIDEMEGNHVNWILLEDDGIDGREDLRFRNTHRLMWEYMVKQFEVVPEGLPDNFLLLRRKAADGAGPL